MFSLSVDFDNQNEVTLTGYADRWQWNHKTVKRYLEKWGVEIIYQSSTKSMQNQRGMIKGKIKEGKGNDQGNEKGIIKFIDLSCLRKTKEGKRNDQGNEKGMKREGSVAATLNPINPNPKEKIYKKEKFSEAFSRWWETYPKRNGRRIGKQATAKQFEKIAESDWKDLKTATANYTAECNGLPKDPERFLKNNFWKDYLKPASPRGTPRNGERNDNPTFAEVYADMVRDNGGVEPKFKLLEGGK
jgi:hypothetical protein